MIKKGISCGHKQYILVLYISLAKKLSIVGVNNVSPCTVFLYTLGGNLRDYNTPKSYQLWT